MGQFSAGAVNKAAPSFRNMLTVYVKAGVKHFEHLLYTSKCVHACSVFAVSLLETVFETSNFNLLDCRD